MDKDALPFYNLSLIAAKPPSKKYPNDIYSLGDLIRAARIEKGLFQKDVAKIIGVDTSTLENWERRRSIPRQKYMAKIVNFTSSLKNSRDLLNTGNKLLSERKSRRLSQKKMSILLGISLNTYRQIEQGSLSMYSRTYDKIRQFLDSIEDNS